MARKIKKAKKSKNSKPLIKGTKEKLPRGRKLCQNCQAILYIHQTICPHCSYHHSMKKNKHQILKILNKNQPKALRGVLENNQFNRPLSNIEVFEYPSSELRQVEVINKIHKQKYLQKIPCNENFIMFKSLYPLSCVCCLGNDILFTESVEKQILTELTTNQQITIKTFKLNNYHLVGQKYKGETNLCYLSKKSVQYKIKIHEDILMMKNIMNKVALLTGQGNIIILCVPTESQLNNSSKYIIEYQITKQIKISEKGIFFTTFQWLNKSSNKTQDQLIGGTLNGELLIYNVGTNNEYYLYRIIPFAHLQEVTAICQCPLLSNSDSNVFASGSFDGSVKVWDIGKEVPIFEIQICNVLIVQVWDSGAKYIFVVRDQIQDNCIMICFYSINRTQFNLCLASQVELRMVKTGVGSYITASDSLSTIIPIINTLNGCITLLSCQQLRKNSLKKKKNNQTNHNNYQIKLQNDTTLPHQFPLISDFKYHYTEQNNIFAGTTYRNHLFILKITNKQANIE